jgi:site-specific recombinase XerD
VIFERTGAVAVPQERSTSTSVHPISARESRAKIALRLHLGTSRTSFRSRISTGAAAKFTFLVHSHMLRHACGFKLANDGHDTRAIQAYLGHRSIMSTVCYAALTPNRFKNFWRD